MLSHEAKANKENKETASGSSAPATHRTNWIVIVCAILIAIACTANTIHNIWFAGKGNQVPTTEQQDNYYQDPFASDSIANDTTAIDSLAKFQ